MASNRDKIDASTWDGSLSRDEFRTAALAFVERWNKFNTAFPQCSRVASSKLPWLNPTSQVEEYLSVENVILPCTTEAQTHVHEIHYYDFHIVYSLSYRVPVLYFRAYCSDGQPLTLDEIEKNIPANSVKVLKESKWTFMTQEDHPYLNRPWYMLHPCGTMELMKLLFMNENSKAQSMIGISRYLVSWFSVVGQVFGLKVPFVMLDESNEV